MGGYFNDILCLQGRDSGWVAGCRGEEHKKEGRSFFVVRLLTAFWFFYILFLLGFVKLPLVDLASKVGLTGSGGLVLGGDAV